MNEPKTWYRRPVVVGPAAVALVAAVAGGWLVFARGGPPGLSDDGAKEIAAGFLAEVRAGKVDDAWAGTSTEFKSMSGREVFRKYARSKPVLKEAAEFAGCEFKADGDLRVAECAFRPAGGKGTIKVVLNPDGGRWKVGKLAVE